MNHISIHQKCQIFSSRKNCNYNPKELLLHFICFRIYPEMVEALKMETIKTPPFYNLETLKTRGGKNFVSFAKSRQFKTIQDS